MFLSGKLYYDLVKERSAWGLGELVAFVRIEELSPFPFWELEEVVRELKGAKEFVWVQEEPKNQGAWGHVRVRIGRVLKGVVGRVGDEELGYKGRKESVVSAPGVGRLYVVQREVVDSVFEGLSVGPPYILIY